MQTSYLQNIRRAIKGQPLCAPRKSRARQLPWLPQISTLTVTAGALTTDLVITVVDDKSGQSYSVTVTGSANEATLGASLLTAWRAHARLNMLFSVANTTASSGSDLVTVFTARHANRTYTMSATGGTSATPPAFAATQAAGGALLEWGQLVAKGSGDDEFQAMTSTTTVRDIAGFLYRTDANHFHSLEADTPTAVDACRRGVHYPIAEEGEFYVQVAEDVTPNSRVYVRVEGSNIGDWGDTPAGTAQVATITAIADAQVYRIVAFLNVDGVRRQLEFEYAPTDGTTTTDLAIDGMEAAAAAAIIAQGLTGIVAASAASASATMTLTLTAGYAFEYVDGSAFFEDASAEAMTVSTAAADADMLDVSAICKYTSTTLSGGLASVALRLQP